MKKRLIAIIAFGVACVLAGTCIGANLPQSASAEAPTVTTVVTSPFTAAVAEVKNSVVGINNYQIVRYNNSTYGWGDYFNYFGWGDPWGDSYGNRGQETTQEVKAASGSGVVIAEHYVLTNYHVVENASTLKIALMAEDGTISEEGAVLVASDQNLDIAILYAPDLNIRPVTLGDSDSLQVGDWAICIGNPLSDTFFGTVTTGIVSALNRSVSSSSYDKYGRRETITNTMIQVDAAINNGNSGGGMFSVTGELMGVPTLKYSGSAYSGAAIDGIGMCIPINAAKPLIEDVLSGAIQTPEVKQQDEAASADTGSGSGLVGKPRMGVSITGMNASSAAVMNGTLPNGVYVSKVEPFSPAERGGMQAGDIIVECNGTVITSVTQLQGIIAQLQEGDTAHVKVYRVPGLADIVGGTSQTSKIPDGEYIDLDVTLAVLDDVKQ